MPSLQWSGKLSTTFHGQCYHKYNTEITRHTGDRNPSWRMGQEKLEGLESRVPDLKLEAGPENKNPVEWLNASSFKISKNSIKSVFTSAWTPHWGQEAVTGDPDAWQGGQSGLGDRLSHWLRRQDEKELFSTTWVEVPVLFRICFQEAGRQVWKAQTLGRSQI